MKSDIPSIVVIGTSAGGLGALAELIGQLPSDFPGAVFIVQHMSADSTGKVLVSVLEKKGRLVCKHARDGEKIEAGRIYVAPSDHHMLVEKGTVLVTKGAMENRARPGIDPLFRSAAVAYGSRVIGILLTGYLDDGTSGLIAIQRCGGTCIVQDPEDAEYPDMPQNALNNLKPDYCLGIGEMGARLALLAAAKPAHPAAIPEDLVIEAKIAKRVLSDLDSVEALGAQVPFNCPACGGVLWEISKGNPTRYRCHTGHAFTSAILLAEQTAKIEETLWVALRMFEERRNLLLTMSDPKRGGPNRSASERAEQSLVHIERIRTMLKSSDKATNDDAGRK